MQASDYKNELTQKFIDETQEIEEFYIEKYTKTLMTYEELQESKLADRNSIPLVIFNFPWNEQFEGLEFQIGKISIDKGDNGNTQLTYHYHVLNNPTGLDIATDDEKESRETADNELLDAFIGRLIESSLYRMTQDDEFLEKKKTEA